MPKPMCFVGHSHVPIALLRLTEDPSRTAYSLDSELDHWAAKMGVARTSLKPAAR